MAKSYFREKELQPSDESLKDILQAGKAQWDAYVDFINQSVSGASGQWKYYGKAWGWCLVFIEKKKNIVYLTPDQERFFASFVFNDKNRITAQEMGVPADILSIIESGKANSAGHTFDIIVQDSKDLELVKMLLKIKCNQL